MTANEARKITNSVFQEKKKNDIATAAGLLEDVIYPGIKAQASKGLDSFSLQKSPSLSVAVYSHIAEALRANGYKIETSLNNVMPIRW